MCPQYRVDESRVDRFRLAITSRQGEIIVNLPAVPTGGISVLTARGTKASHRHLSCRHKQIACHRSSCSQHDTIVCSEGSCHGGLCGLLTAFASLLWEDMSILCCLVGLFLQNSKVVSYTNCFFLRSYACLCINAAESLKTISLHSQFENKKVM